MSAVHEHPERGQSHGKNEGDDHIGAERARSGLGRLFLVVWHGSPFSVLSCYQR